MFKKTIWFFVFWATALSLLGCEEITRRNELVDLVFPGVAAVDKTKDGNVVLTISPKRAESGGSGKDSESKEKSSEQTLMQSTGKTVFDASTLLTAYSYKDIHWGQNEYIIIGEDAARDDIMKYLDFFVRNHETRLDTSVVIVKENTANQLIKDTQASSPQIIDELANLFKNEGELSYNKKIELSEFINCLNCDYAATILPAVRMAENKSLQEQDSCDAKDLLLYMDSFAVFKKFELIGYLNGKDARAVNWISDSLHSATMLAEDSEGNIVSLEVTDNKTKIKAKIKDGVPSIKVNIRFSSNIAETQGKTDVFKDDELISLIRQQSLQVQEETERVVELTKQNNVDIFHFRDALFKSEPVKWEKIKDQWDELYPNLDVEIIVESNINRSYLIDRPVGASAKK
ncbi:MAG: Ger(x)C family spore germination protein [Firmicutes bacterium]|nr:Ger(x)C family spore germination protein [Bacillota bacterium]